MYANGVLVQSKFLTDIIQKLGGDGAQEVLDNLECLRKIVTDPSRLTLYVAGCLDNLEDAVTPLNNFLKPEAEHNIHP